VQGESLCCTVGERGCAVTRGQETETHGNKVNLITYGVLQKNVRYFSGMVRNVNNSYVVLRVMRFVELQIILYGPADIQTWKFAAVSAEVLSNEL
jgi:hypothetical protein